MMFKSVMRHGRFLARSILARCGVKTRRYRIGALALDLNQEHKLPEYQAAHRLYDSFLPVLCRHLQSGWVIDIGANVGDTVISMAPELDGPVLCIEAEETYFQLLQQNTALLTDRGQTILCRNLLVGTGDMSGSLQKIDGGTASLAAGPGTSVFHTLDSIVQEHAIESVGLLKIDTDGFDGDVIHSGAKTIENTRLVFWENCFFTPEQAQLLDSSYAALERCGFRYVWIFDNIGNLMLDECRFKEASSINTYLFAQRFCGIGETMPYVDILAATEDGVAEARAAVADYKSLIRQTLV
jgi:FkbM family methyltransferase